MDLTFRMQHEHLSDIDETVLKIDKITVYCIFGNCSMLLLAFLGPYIAGLGIIPRQRYSIKTK